MIINRLGLALAILGILPYAALQCWVILQQRTWTPLRYSLSLRPGSITSPEFTTRASTGYRILLEFDRRIAFQRMECLLGLESWQADEKCRNIPEAVDVSWRVLSDGRANSIGSSRDTRGGSYSDTIAKEIGRFDARSGQHNVVLLDVKRDGRELDSTAPRLVVQVYPGYWEGTVILLQLAFFGAVLVGVPGLIVLGGPPFVRAIRRAGRSFRLHRTTAFQSETKMKEARSRRDH